MHFAGGRAAERGTFEEIMGPILASNVSCLEDEYTVTECTNTTVLPDICSHATDAAVVCQPGSSKQVLPEQVVENYQCFCPYSCRGCTTGCQCNGGQLHFVVQC